MITIFEKGVFLVDGKELLEAAPETMEKLKPKMAAAGTSPEKAAKGSIAYGMLKNHNTSGNMDQLKIKFDAMASHDITYVGIVQTARASGMTQFPIPYALTNCHNSLSAVGGTINEDDHVFGLSAAKKYGGIYVPAHQAVIHQYMREMFAGCGKMILGSDSHTRYGSIGTMAIGEGGPELVKQLLGRTYDVDMPEIFAINLVGQPQRGIGPMDVALALIGAVFQKGIVTNKVLEFVGEGIRHLSSEFRIGIDVMTTETTCLSTIWQTDDSTKEFLMVHGRPEEYKELKPAAITYYDGGLTLDLGKVPSMIAMPFHPSNVYPIHEINANLPDILREIEKKAQEQVGKPIDLGLQNKVRDGHFMIDQAVIVGCSGGTFENICDAADILDGYYVGSDALALSVYPSSQPTNLALTKAGVMTRLMESGASIRSAFCGPCFGAGDVPANGAFSMRHATRNFPNRDGSRPGDNQFTSVALADARSIAATVRNGGRLTAATDIDITYTRPTYTFDQGVYKHRCYNGFGQPQPETDLIFGPNITDWPAVEPLAENLFLQMAAVISDPVTTTDELIPSGETSSYRSNPLRLAEFTLSRKDPAYVGRAKDVQRLEQCRLNGTCPLEEDELFKKTMIAASQLVDYKMGQENIGIGSAIYAVRPGDGSAREQAASCQKVLGTFANIAKDYATKRYRSNLINWGMVPFQLEQDEIPFEIGDYLFVPEIRGAVADKTEQIKAYIIRDGAPTEITLVLRNLTDDERQIILDGCLMNYYKNEEK